MTFRIESVQNDRIKNAVKIAQSSKARAQQGLFFLEGLRLCADLLESELKIDTVFYTELFQSRHAQTLSALAERAENAFSVSDAAAQKLAQTESPQGVFCLAQMPRFADPALLCPPKIFVALEGIQDPANLGAICRTAEALGLDGAILSGCCDAFHPKTLRASMGALFRLKLFFCGELPTLLKEKKAQGMQVYATTPHQPAESVTTLCVSHGAIAVIGNEANGVSEAALSVCTRVTIPMHGRAESLNASMAASIVMWELMKQTNR